MNDLVLVLCYIGEHPEPVGYTVHDRWTEQEIGFVEIHRSDPPLYRAVGYGKSAASPKLEVATQLAWLFHRDARRRQEQTGGNDAG